MNKSKLTRLINKAIKNRVRRTYRMSDYIDYN